eukprot:gene25288-30537_t
MKIHVNDFLLPAVGEVVLRRLGLSLDTYHLIILNSPSLPYKLLPRLWSQSTTRICADGGANRLFKSFVDGGDRGSFIPDCIIGDLDSIENEVVEYYKSKGTSIVKRVDQDHNDLDKSLQHLHSELVQKSSPSAADTVLILGGLGGRFDQEMASLHSLFKWQRSFHRLVLVDERSTTRLLESDDTHCIVPLSSSSESKSDTNAIGGLAQAGGVEEGRYCGLIPIGGSVRSLHTAGLQWNLQGEGLAFGQLISTSNTIPRGTAEVRITASDPVVWTCSYVVS